MGNCQAIDAATLVIQHPNGKVDNLYWPVPASEIMKMNPGHYVALFITTTICHSTTTSKSENTTKPENTTTRSESTTSKTNNNIKNNTQKSSSNSKGVEDKNSSAGSGTTGSNRNSVRITRVKLLRPTDILVLGHVYRLISAQEVMKGLVAKKQAKTRKNGIELADSEALKEAEKLARKSQLDKTHKVSRHGHGHRSRSTPAPVGGTAKPKTWQPSLHSISEAAS